MAIFEHWKPTQKLSYKAPIVFFNNLIPFKGFIAINLFGILFVRKEYKSQFENSPESIYVKRILCHEYTHTLQQREMLFIFFYFWYLIEWLYQAIAAIFTKKIKAYHMICFEQEAYANEKNPEYNKARKHYAWVKWLFKYKIPA